MKLTSGLFRAARLSNLMRHAFRGPGSLIRHLVRKRVAALFFRLLP